MSESIPPPGSGNGTGSGPVARVATLPLPEDSNPDAVPALGSVIAGKYRIEELIARGGMGAVYMATHLVSGKRVALKWMLPSLGQVPGAKERFVREACATARIEHPNVIDIYDVGNDRGSVYLVMELLRGETLAEYLQRTPAVNPVEAVQLLMPALRGVAAAHAHDVIHRDLKPDNIFLCRSPDGEPREPRVLDFGISKIGSDEDGRNMSLTRSGAVMGTPYYMSPEQVRGAKDVDERSDVYAFGVILYEMLTGQRPFDAETYNQLILKIATEDPPAIPLLNPNVDRGLVAVVERAMARDVAARFRSVEELGLALEPYSGGALFRASIARVLTPAASSGEHSFRSAAPRASARRSRSLVLLGVVLGCIGGGLGLWAFSSYRPPAAESTRQAATAPPAAVPRPQRPPSGLVAPAAATGPEPASGAVVAPVDHGPAGVPGPAPGRSHVTSREQRVVRPVEREAATKRAEARASKRAAAAPGVDENVSRPSSSARPEASEQPLPAAAGIGDPGEGGKLPDDWDDQLTMPARPPRGTSAPAGSIDMSDLQ